MKTDVNDRLRLVHTACKNCAFARYEGDTQVGCDFNDRTVKFGEQGCLLEAYDEEKEFFIINGRRCHAFRDRNRWEGDPAKAREELRQKVDILIPYLNGDTLDSLLTTIGCVRGQSMRPHSVEVVNNSDEKVSRLHAFLASEARGLNWLVREIVERDKGGSRVPLGRLIDLTVAGCKGHFYGVFRPGAVIPKGYVEGIDRHVVDHLARWVVLLPDESGNGLTVARGFHNSAMVQGNRKVSAARFDDPENPAPGSASLMLESVADKAVYIATRRNMPHLVAKAEDVCWPC